MFFFLGWGFSIIFGRFFMIFDFYGVFVVLGKGSFWINK